MDLARRLRRRPTNAEEILWACLRNRRSTGAKFRRQHPLGRYIADFYCQEAALAIELDGGGHEIAAQAEYDAIRQDELEQRGVKVLRIKNAEVIDDLTATLNRIVEVLKSLKLGSLSLRERDGPSLAGRTGVRANPGRWKP